MFTISRSAIALFIFGAVVIGSGVFQFVTSKSGHNGLYFGLVMGGLALAGALLVALKLRWTGSIVGYLAIAFVLLWFGYEMYGAVVKKHKFGRPEIRKSIVLAAGLAAAIALALPSRKPAKPEMP